MAKIRQYFPNFYSGFDPQTIEFNTQKELLKIDFVKGFSENKTFFRYSLIIDDNKTSEFKSTLMAEYKNGYKWFVVGSIDNVDSLNLPKWKSKDREE